MLWRIALRLSSPPAPPVTTLAERVGGVVHWALYAVLILTPLSGGVAWFGGQEGAAEAHETLTGALLALTGLHVTGALYHQFIVKDGLLSRMSPH
ncbi:MAG: cytochrome b/b6 domain-containing protein [Paracoccus sp. (in: a-proteobacteria)]|nr:cytochrome b/b6 domain-containing protein [Paracoccus sp. (in: a-proteobacteria)]